MTGDKISDGPQRQRWATSPMPPTGVPNASARGKKTQWPISRRISDITLTIWGVPNARLRGMKTSMAHKWKDWLHRMLGAPPLRAVEHISNGQQLGGRATSNLPYRGP